MYIQPRVRKLKVIRLEYLSSIAHAYIKRRRFPIFPPEHQIIFLFLVCHRHDLRFLCEAPSLLFVHIFHHSQKEVVRLFWLLFPGSPRRALQPYSSYTMSCSSVAIPLRVLVCFMCPYGPTELACKWHKPWENKTKVRSDIGTAWSRRSPSTMLLSYAF